MESEKIFDIEKVQSIKNIFLVELNSIEIINNSIDMINNFLNQYSDEYISELGEGKIVKEILFLLKEKGSINEADIDVIVAELIQQNETEKKNTGFFEKFINLFKNIFSKKSVNNSELVSDYRLITEKIIRYFKAIANLNEIINQVKINDILEKAYQGISINSQIKEYLKILKQYKIYLEAEPEKFDEITNNDNADKVDEVSEEIKSEIYEKENITKAETTEESTDKISHTMASKFESIIINEVFTENIFKIFINYCNENGLINFNQLLSFDFSKLDKLRGFGVGKKEKLLARYNEIINSVSSSDEQDFIKENKSENIEYTEEIIESVNEEYKKLHISVLECFNKINSKMIQQIEAININTLEELYLKVAKGKLIVPNLGATKVKYIKDALEKFKMNPEELFIYLFSELKENPDYTILMERGFENKTLQEVGEERGVSRERIRQREKKIVNSVKAMLDLFIIINNSANQSLVTINDCIGIKNLNEEDATCLKYVLLGSDDKNIQYYKEIDKFLLNGNKEKLDSQIRSLANGMPDIVNINTELIYDVEEYDSLKIFTMDEIVNIIISLGYKKVNDYLIRGTVSKERIYTFIVKEFFKKGITFSDEEDMNKFINILNEEFHIEDNSIRNIKAKIERNCVLCNRGSYIHQEWISIDNELLEIIKEYIDDNSQDTIYINQIFTEFETKLVECGIDNRYYLQGILKYYFSDKYKFTKDTLYKGNIKYDRNYIFNKYIKDKGRIVTKEDIENDFKGWTPIMFTMAEEECRYVLKWDNGGYIHASLIKSSLEDIEELNEEIGNILEEKESVTIIDVYDRLHERFNKFFVENSIDNGFKLFSVLEYLLSKKYYFRRPYILRNKPKETVSAVYLIRKMFREYDKVTYEQLKDYCISIKLNDTTRMNAINTLLKDTIEIEKETYILKDNFNIEEEAIEQIKNTLLSMIYRKEYIALRAIEDYSNFPNIGYEWNSYLLNDICEEFIPEVKELKRKFYDKRYSSPVLVEEGSKYNDLLDLIIEIIRNDFDGAVKASQLEQCLKDKCFIYDKIPYEVYESDDIVIEDNIIKIK